MGILRTDTLGGEDIGIGTLIEIIGIGSLIGIGALTEQKKSGLEGKGQPAKVTVV